MTRYFFLLGLLLSASPCVAQTADLSAPVTAPAAQPAEANNKKPIEITASKTVEWLRNQKQYVARENVIVTQGAMTINTDLLTADYHEGAKSSMEIWQLTAEGNVQIKDANNTAYGDKAVYDVTQGIATLTGTDLKIVSPEQTVTATERMEYHANTREAKAIGSAKVVRAQNTLTADTISAFFKDQSAVPEPTPAATSIAATTTTPPAPANGLGGNSSLDRLEADGNVVIVTPTEKLSGQKGIYLASTNTAEIIGKVKIERGENTLEGERAEVNLTTNVSKMFGSKKEGGRVRGIFFPGSDKPEKKGQDKKPAKSVPKAPETAKTVPAPIKTVAPSAKPVPVPPKPAADSATIPAPNTVKVAP